MFTFLFLGGEGPPRGEDEIFPKYFKSLPKSFGKIWKKFGRFLWAQNFNKAATLPIIIRFECDLYYFGV